MQLVEPIAQARKELAKRGLDQVGGGTWVYGGWGMGPGWPPLGLLERQKTPKIDQKTCFLPFL